MIPFKSILPLMLEQAGYFQQSSMTPKKDMFKVERLPPCQFTAQDDSYSCGMFCLSFILFC